MRAYKLTSRWRNDCRRPSKLEYAWFNSFADLGLEPSFIEAEIRIGDHVFRPTLWLDQWSCYIYVIPKREVWDEAIGKVLVEAEMLSDHLQDVDVLVVSGSPFDPFPDVSLYSRKFRSDSEERYETYKNDWWLQGIADMDTGDCSVILASHEYVYSPRSKTWGKVCGCGNQCADCRAVADVVADSLVCPPQERECKDSNMQNCFMRSVRRRRRS